MAEPNEPKKETVRIKLPADQASGGSDSNSEHRDTVRINLPPRAPALPGLGQLPKAPSFPLPSIAGQVASSRHAPSIAESIVDAPLVPPAPPSVAQKAPPVPLPGPKKETARIAIVPAPKSPTVKMSKTQPLVTAPEPTSGVAPVFVEREDSAEAVESTSVPLCWALVGISALIFIIQVWTYLS